MAMVFTPIDMCVTTINYPSELLVRDSRPSACRVGYYLLAATRLTRDIEQLVPTSARRNVAQCLESTLTRRRRGVPRSGRHTVDSVIDEGQIIISYRGLDDSKLSPHASFNFEIMHSSASSDADTPWIRRSESFAV